VGRGLAGVRGEGGGGGGGSGGGEMLRVREGGGNHQAPSVVGKRESERGREGQQKSGAEGGGWDE